MAGTSGFLTETNERESEDEKTAQQGQPDEIGHSMFLPVPGAAGWNRHLFKQPRAKQRQGEAARKQQDDPKADCELPQSRLMGRRYCHHPVGEKGELVAAGKKREAKRAQDDFSRPPALAPAQTIKMTRHKTNSRM